MNAHSISRALLRTGVLGLLLLAPTASAQRGTTSVRVKRLPTPQANLYPAGFGAGSPRSNRMAAGVRPAIMLTGYWSPTNEMLRGFSASPRQNPDGWIGSDWEGRGYDVYAFFPEYPHGGSQGEGDFEVDYQDTSQDFWPIANGLAPIAIITFSLGYVDNSWELERVNRNHAQWINDFSPPYQPTPTPPDASLPAETRRFSSLPLDDVVSAIEVMNLDGADPYIDMGGGGGGFLSEFIGYHGVWYRSLHEDPSDPAWCVAAGHVHVGAMNSLFRARKLSRQVVRAVIRHVDEVMGVSGGRTEWYCPTSPATGSTGAVLTVRGSHFLGQNNLELYVIQIPPLQLGLAFCGPTQASPTPFGDGQLCIPAPLFRLGPPRLSTTGRELFLPLDSTLPGQAYAFAQITAGSTWNFQVWYRDTGSTGAGYNLTSGLGLAFAP
jgi:hypothetical protein